MTALQTSRTDTLRDQALALIAERDLRFYNDMNVYRVLANRTAGEVIRDAAAEPFLDHEGAAVLANAMRTYAVPAMNDGELGKLIHCLRFCPRVAS